MSGEMPVARDGDIDSVAWALRTACSLYESGDTAEALAWLRRAARHAADAGRDMRAGELFAAAGRVSSASLLDSAGAFSEGAFSEGAFSEGAVADEAVSDEAVADETHSDGAEWLEGEFVSDTGTHLARTQETPAIRVPSSTMATVTGVEKPAYRQRADTLMNAVPSETFVSSSRYDKIAAAEEGLNTTLPAAGISGADKHPRTYRVAFIAGSDAGCAVALRLSQGDVAPEGAVGAIVIPNSLDDARLLESLWD